MLLESSAFNTNYTAIFDVHAREVGYILLEVAQNFIENMLGRLP